MSQAKEILAASSIYYIQRPFASKHLIIKLIWVIFLIVLFFGSNYYVLLNILDYLDYNTVTSIYEIDENESQFPIISICSENIKNFEINLLTLKVYKMNGKIICRLIMMHTLVNAIDLIQALIGKINQFQ